MLLLLLSLVIAVNSLCRPAWAIVIVAVVVVVAYRSPLIVVIAASHWPRVLIMRCAADCGLDSATTRFQGLPHVLPVPNEVFPSLIASSNPNSPYSLPLSPSSLSLFVSFSRSLSLSLCVFHLLLITQFSLPKKHNNINKRKTASTLTRQAACFSSFFSAFSTRPLQNESSKNLINNLQQTFGPSNNNN